MGASTALPKRYGQLWRRVPQPPLPRLAVLVPVLLARHVEFHRNV